MTTATGLERSPSTGVIGLPPAGRRSSLGAHAADPRRASVSGVAIEIMSQAPSGMVRPILARRESGILLPARVHDEASPSTAAMERMVGQLLEELTQSREEIRGLRAALEAAKAPAQASPNASEATPPVALSSDDSSPVSRVVSPAGADAVIPVEPEAEEVPEVLGRGTKLVVWLGHRATTFASISGFAAVNIPDLVAGCALSQETGKIILIFAGIMGALAFLFAHMPRGLNRIRHYQGLPKLETAKNGLADGKIFRDFLMLAAVVNAGVKIWYPAPSDGCPHPGIPALSLTSTSTHSFTSALTRTLSLTPTT